MSATKVRILDHDSIKARLKRMAFEIYEANYSEEGLFVIGIDERGGFLGRELMKNLEQISPLKLTFVESHLDRSQAAFMGIELSIEIEELYGKSIVVVDDVLYSGNTLLQVVSILLQAVPSKLRTAVLIDRGHRTVPVSSDFVGMVLATTIQQHVSVEIHEETKKIEAFLL